MSKIIIPIFMGLLCISFTIIPKLPAGNGNSTAAVTGFYSLIPDSSLAVKDAANTIYNNCNLKEHGLSAEAFHYAWKGYQHLLRKKMIQRSDYLTICDFSQPSGQKRLYIIDVTHHTLIRNTYVAHGKNSGGEYATKFSNRHESLQSSLGFYITSHTYNGAHGLSLRVNGVDPGYNDQALARTIVIHGAAYVDEARARQGIFMGRSYGCPAVPQKESATIISTIKNGTCLFIYHPGKAYLHGSKILNG